MTHRWIVFVATIIVALGTASAAGAAVVPSRSAIPAPQCIDEVGHQGSASLQPTGPGFESTSVTEALRSAALQPGDLPGFHEVNSVEDGQATLYEQSWRANDCASAQRVEVALVEYPDVERAHSGFQNAASAPTLLARALDSQGVGSEDASSCLGLGQIASPRLSVCFEVFRQGVVVAVVWGSDIPVPRLLSIAQVIDRRILASLYGL